MRLNPRLDCRVVTICHVFIICVDSSDEETKCGNVDHKTYHWHLLHSDYVCWHFQAVAGGMLQRNKRYQSRDGQEVEVRGRNGTPPEIEVHNFNRYTWLCRVRISVKDIIHPGTVGIFENYRFTAKVSLIY